MPTLTTNFGFNKPLVNNATDADLWGAQLNTNWDNLDTYLYQRTPPGVIFIYMAAAAPTGWLVCDGSAVSRTTYAALFAVIGESCGQGDNSTTFNLPSFNGTFLCMWDNGAGRDPDAASRTAMATGGNTGDNIGSIQGDATSLPSADFTTDSQGTHDHASLTTSTPGFVGNNAFATGATTSTEVFNLSSSAGQKIFRTDSAGAHTHTVSAGGDNETRPINAYVNLIIKT